MVLFHNIIQDFFLCAGCDAGHSQKPPQGVDLWPKGLLCYSGKRGEIWK
jgi:hypothetical protein